MLLQLLLEQTAIICWAIFTALHGCGACLLHCNHLSSGNHHKRTRNTVSNLRTPQTTQPKQPTTAHTPHPASYQSKARELGSQTVIHHQWCWVPAYGGCGWLLSCASVTQLARLGNQQPSLHKALSGSHCLADKSSVKQVILRSSTVAQLVKTGGQSGGASWVGMANHSAHSEWSGWCHANPVPIQLVIRKDGQS